MDGLAFLPGAVEHGRVDLWGATNGRVYASAGGQSPGRRGHGGGRVDRDELRDEREAAAGSPGRSDVDDEEFERMLAEQPDEPPTPAEQAARDDNDALGDR